MDFKIVDFENRPGYYKDEYGNWHEERREEPDRRGGVETAAQSASRKTARRKMDRDVLSFLGIEM